MSYPSATDHLAGSMRLVAQQVLTILFGVLPLLFLPLAGAPLGYSKVILLLVALLFSVIFLGLATLRSGSVQLVLPSGLLALWGVVGISAASALVSGDLADTFVGELFEVQTVLFLTLLAVTATLVTNVLTEKRLIMRLYMILATSTVALGLFHLVRLVVGPELLSFGTFTASTSSLVGGWNDVAIFFGLAVLLSMVVLEQLPLPQFGRILFGAVIVISLLMLAVVNFPVVWFILGLVSLAVIMYALTKDRFRPEQQLVPTNAKPPASPVSLVMTIVVFITSVLFITGGSFIGDRVSQFTGVSFMEVRPSITATIDIARNIYGENAFVGIGPNKFGDAWRLYKDPAINSTIFWNTTFSGGSGYIPTFFATTGVFGAVGWIIFLGLFLYTGFRTLVRATQGDKFWYFIASSSFVAASYLWTLAVLYTPGSTVLLLAAVFTGLSFAATATLLPRGITRLSFVADRRAGFVLVAGVMVVIVGAVGALYYVGRHVIAQQTFVAAIGDLSRGQDRVAAEQAVADAFALRGSDRFAREVALYQLGRMNRLLAIDTPTAAQQQEFQAAVANGVNAGRLAVQADDTDAANWATLGTIYSVLSLADIEGAEDRARNALTRAQALDPQNPEYKLLEAQLDARVGNEVAAREKVAAAISLKQNYTDALLFLAELDIAAGDPEAALATTRAIISLEPRNPARYYQLGVLSSALNNTDDAIAAFEQAVALDQNYANARYLLALSYIDEGRTEEAIAELEVVRDLNPNNQVVQSLIDELKSGTDVDLAATPDVVAEPTPTSVDDGSITTSPTTVPNSDLLTPVNSVAPGAPSSVTPPSTDITLPVDDLTSDEEVTEDEVTQEGEGE